MQGRNPPHGTIGESGRPRMPVTHQIVGSNPIGPAKSFMSSNYYGKQTKSNYFQHVD